jgi:hypothetical protein
MKNYKYIQILFALALSINLGYKILTFYKPHCNLNQKSSLIEIILQLFIILILLGYQIFSKRTDT